jgi:hypothetical protein
VVAIAALEQAARTLEPGLSVVGLRDIELLEAVKVFPGERVDIEIAAERAEIASGALETRGKLTSDGKERHRAVIRLGANIPDAPIEERSTPRDAGPIASELYRTFFHGPSFQVVDRTFVDDDHVLARSPRLTLPFGADIAEEARVVALVRELAFQACGAHLLVIDGELALPVGIAELDVHGTPRDGEVVDALAVRRGADDRHRWFDVTTYGEDGRVLERMRGARFRLLAKVRPARGRSKS